MLLSMKVELPVHMAAAEDVVISTEERKKSISGMQITRSSSAVKQVLSMQPSSAAAERVFSILKSSFTNEQQEGAIVDYLQASVMFQNDKR